MKFGQTTVSWSAPEGLVATRGAVLVVNYRGAITADVMRATEQAQRAVLAAHGGACVMLSVVESGLPLPDESGRAMILSHFRTVSSRNSAYATVVLGDGFWASAARSIMSTWTLAIRSKSPSLTSGDIESGAKFLASNAPTHLDGEMLAMEVDALRRSAARGLIKIEA